MYLNVNVKFLSLLNFALLLNMYGGVEG